MFSPCYTGSLNVISGLPDCAAIFHQAFSKRIIFYCLIRSGRANVCLLFTTTLRHFFSYCCSSKARLRRKITTISVYYLIWGEESEYLASVYIYASPLVLLMLFKQGQIEKKNYCHQFLLLDSGLRANVRLVFIFNPRYLFVYCLLHKARQKKIL